MTEKQAATLDKIFDRLKVHMQRYVDGLEYVRSKLQDELDEIRSAPAPFYRWYHDDEAEDEAIYDLENYIRRFDALLDCIDGGVVQEINSIKYAEYYP